MDEINEIFVVIMSSFWSIEGRWRVRASLGTV